MLKTEKRTKQTLICGIAAIVWLTIPGGVWAGTERIDAPPSGVELGLGWNGMSASLVRNRCVQFAPIQEGGQQATLSLSEVSDSEELRKQLGVSVSASIHGVGATASGSAEFAENAEVKTSSTNFVVRAAITNGVMFAGPHRPPAPRRYAFSATEIQPTPLGIEKPEAPGLEADTIRILDWVIDEVKKVRGNNPADTNDDKMKKAYDTFVSLCGTDFVSAIYSGVEMFTILSVSTTDEKSKSEVKAKVSASYGVGAGEADFSVDNEKKLASMNTKMSFFQRGGAGGILPSSREKILQKLDFIAREATDAPEFFDMEITSYADLPNWPFPGSAPQGKEGDKAIVVRRYYQLKTIYRDLEAVIDNLRTQNPVPVSQPSHSANENIHEENADNLPVPANYDVCYSAAYYEDMQDDVLQILQSIEKAQKVVSESGWDYTKFGQDIEMEESSWFSLGVQDAPGEEPAPEMPKDKEKPFLKWLDENLPIAHLKSHLPPLKIGNKSQCETFAEEHRHEYQQRVMDLYIRPANVRACERSTRDRDCLSNDALSQIEQSIPYPPLTQVEIKPGAEGYLCNANPRKPLRCVSKNPSEGHYALTKDKSLFALIQVLDGGPGGSVKLRVPLSGSGDAGTALKSGKNFKKARAEPKWLRHIDQTKPDVKEFTWMVIKGGKHFPIVRFLEATEKDHCLLVREEERLYTYPNECKSRGNWEKSFYGWILMNKTSFD
jgi:hypothetical protein